MFPHLPKSIYSLEVASMAHTRAFATLGILLGTVSLHAQNGFLAPTGIVRTSQGDIQGFSDGAVDTFLGIPYASPPVGGRRWQAPLSASRWDGVRDAIQQGSQCVQPNGDGSEDCLYLNIYRPAGTDQGQSLPVIYFIHGGGNQQGSLSLVVRRRSLRD
jgi:para-nitrobenzyl esterase